MRLFHRPIDYDDDSYENILPLLEALNSSKSHERQAMARNLAVDWRVSPERERAFLDTDFGSTLPPDIKAWLEIYFDKLVRFSPAPEFLFDHNFHNRCPEIVPETELAQVFRVGGLPPEVLGYVIKNMRTAPSELRDVPLTGPRRDAYSEIEGFLTGAFPKSDRESGSISSSSSAEQRAEFIEQLWLYLAANSPLYHPTWVGLWEEFEEYSSGPADVWLSVLGKPKPTRPCLCFLLRYNVEDVTLLLRPTILDAGWFDAHLPSPPPECEWRSQSAPRPSGGHPVNFDSDPKPLIQEFIHTNVARKPGWVVEWGWTSEGYVSKDTPSARAGHLTSLAQCYDKVTDWYDAN